MYVIGAVIWVVLAFLVAASARKKGFGFGAYLALSLVVSPIIGFITLRIAEKRADERDQEAK